MLIGDKFKLLEKIGKGAYGEVYIAANIHTNEFFAVKQVSKSIISDSISQMYFNNEVYILRHLPDHPNLIKFHGIYETFKSYYVVLDFCNGKSLEEIIKRKNTNKNPNINELECRHIIKQLLLAIRELNNNNLIHRDIKCENILLNYKNQNHQLKMDIMNAEIKLIDFGFSAYIQNDKMAESIVGTPLFMDPFILKGFSKKVDNKEKEEGKGGNNKYNINQSKNNKKEKEYDFRTDLWSVGIVMFEMLFGHMPFQAHNPNELKRQIDKDNFNFNLDEHKILSKSTVEFMNKLFIKNFKERPYVDDLLRDKWFTVNFDDEDDPKMELLSLNERNNIDFTDNNVTLIKFFKEYFVLKVDKKQQMIIKDMINSRNGNIKLKQELTFQQISNKEEDNKFNQTPNKNFRKTEKFKESPRKERRVSMENKRPANYKENFNDNQQNNNDGNKGTNDLKAQESNRKKSINNRMSKMEHINGLLERIRINNLKNEMYNEKTETIKSNKTNKNNSISHNNNNNNSNISNNNSNTKDSSIEQEYSPRKTKLQNEGFFLKSDTIESVTKRIYDK